MLTILLAMVTVRSSKLRRVVARRGVLRKDSHPSWHQSLIAEVVWIATVETVQLERR
jgi:hypothetical protein